MFDTQYLSNYASYGGGFNESLIGIHMLPVQLSRD